MGFYIHFENINFKKKNVRIVPKLCLKIQYLTFIKKKNPNTVDENTLLSGQPKHRFICGYLKV